MGNLVEPVDYVIEEGRGESTQTNAGANLKGHRVTPIWPNLHLGGRIVRVDQPTVISPVFIAFLFMDCRE